MGEGKKGRKKGERGKKRGEGIERLCAQVENRHIKENIIIVFYKKNEIKNYKKKLRTEG